MDLEQTLKELETLRIFELPRNVTVCQIILRSKDLPKLPVWLKNHPGLTVRDIVIADLPENTPIEANLVINGIKPGIHAGLSALSFLPAMPRIFLFADEWLVRIASIGLPKIANSPIYIVESDAPQFKKRKPIPDYYKNNQASLDEAYCLFKNREDQLTFARRVKSIITGDSGYLKISPHLEYDHPLVKIEKGDILLDGGLSNMVSAQQSFADKISQQGVIHGFEPIPWMAEVAKRELRPYSNYHVHPFGLADREGEACFSSLGDSSHIGGSAKDECVNCKITTIDKFVEKMNLEKVTALKLDIEGAELAALKGGARLIASQYPKLIICLYHKPEDLYEIPLYLRQIAPDYDFYLGHSSAGFTDTILYAKRIGA